MNRTHVWLALIAMALATSCETVTDWSIAPTDGHGSWERVRERQFLRTLDAQTRAARTPLDLAGSPTDWNTFHQLLQYECDYNTRLALSAGGNRCYTMNGTNIAYCDVLRKTCVANLLEEIAGITAEPVPLGGGSSNHVPILVPAQSTAVNALLHELAAAQARDAVVMSLQCLQGGAGMPHPLGCADTDMGTVTPEGAGTSFGRALAVAAVDALQLADEATQNAVRDTLALADGHYSSAVTTAEAARLATSAPAMSRAHAAHLLIGGDEGLAGALPPAERYTEGAQFRAAFGTLPPLSARGRAALEVFREAALDPADILSPTVTLPSLLIARTPHNVRSRLVALHGLAPATLTANDAAVFASELGLDLDAFAEARALLLQEHQAFARSTAPIFLPPRQLAGGTTLDDLYAASARGPIPPVPEYYATLARHEASPPADHWELPSSGYAARSLAHLRDYAQTAIEQILLGANGYPSDAVRDDVLDVLGPVATSGRAERTARVVLVQNKAVRVLVPTEIAHTDIIAVTSHDALSCATRGTIEGISCEWSQVAPLEPTEWYDATPESGFARMIPIGIPIGAGIDRLYVLRRMAGRSAGQPGSYEPVAGVFWSDGIFTNRLVPVVPELSRQAGEILMPSPDWVTRSQMTCADVAYDERLPLENELSEDGDAFESSWRYWLTRAQQAAREADELGQLVIEQGLSNDMRAEAAAARLEELCGGAVDLDGLIAPDLGDGYTGTCDSTNPCDNPEDRCIGGRCLRDPLLALAELAGNQNPGAQRLMECLGADTVVPFAALGRRGVCLWRQNANPNKICDGALPGQCPVVVGGTGCAELAPAPAGNHWVFVEENLGYFESDAPAAGTTAAPPPCVALRALRQTSAVATWQLVNDVANGFFEPGRTRDLARRIGWEAMPEDFSRLTLDGRPWGPLIGSAFSGVNGDTVVCSSDESIPVCTPYGTAGESVLGCRVASCSDSEQRAVFNDRLARAAVAARRLSLVGFDGIRLPLLRDQALNPLPPGQSPPDPQRLLFLGPGTARLSLAGTGFVWGERSGYADILSGIVGDYTHLDPPVTAYCIDGGGFAWTQVEPWSPGVQVQVGRWETPCDAPVPGSWQDPLVYWPRFVVFDAGIVGADPDGEVDPERMDAWNDAFWAGMSSPGSAVRRYPAGSLGDILFESELRLEPNRRVRVSPTTRLRRYSREPDSAVPHSRPGVMIANARSDEFYVSEVLDAVELICEAATIGGSACGATPPAVTSLDDVRGAVRYLQCGADEIHRTAERVVFANVPRRALDALREQSVIGSYPAVGGDYGQAISELRGALVGLASVPPLIASELRMMASDIENYRIALALVTNGRELSELKYDSQLASQVTECIVSTLRTDWTNPQTFGIGAAVCVNAVVQISIAGRVREIEHANATLEESRQLLEFRERFFTRLTTIGQLTRRIVEQLETIDRSLARLEQIRTGARSALSQALFLDSEPADVHARVNTVMRRRYDLTRVRYERARRDAIRLAYMAKRAIEQRLGIPLSELRDDMALVDAPARWESRVCELSGIDYRRLRDHTALNVETFADEFVGDYVRRLERVVESYQLDHPFVDGRDTSVVSLRNDVYNARALCETPVHNLLYQAGQLDARANHETGEPIWSITGCREAEGGGLVPNCLSVAGLAPGDRGTGSVEPFTLAHHDLSAVRAFRVSFGDPVGTGCAPSECGLMGSTALVQEVPLAPGRYRLSWYGAFAPGETTRSPSGAVEVRGAESGTLLTGTASSTTDGVSDGWTRYWHIFDVDGSEPVAVRIVPSAVDPMISQRVDLAGLMLEDVSRQVVRSASGTYDATAFPPGVFQNTGDRLTRLARTCPDTTGQEFRARNWRRNCIRLCAEGFGRACPRESADTYCYWETSFTITQRDIERGRTFTNAGFARGNYNYRLDSIAVNVVGTGVRNCSESTSPDSCYAGGFVPYSLEHVGPYTVRNVRGEDYDAPLFTARIEHARALASERYLTNPLSSADRALIDDYVRREFRGRPLDGTYVLRVWDEPGVNFQGIEDVQVVLGYRYWTRAR